MEKFGNVRKRCIIWVSPWPQALVRAVVCTYCVLAIELTLYWNLVRDVYVER
jgi:hypothetical protein